MTNVLFSRLRLSDLASLGQRSEWQREDSDVWPSAKAADEYLVVWRPDEPVLPAVIVVPTTVSEFYAWSSTYLSHLTPVSSIARVVTRDWRPVGAARPIVDTGRLLGFWLAEVAASNWARFDPETVTLSEYLGAFTSCLYQSALSSAAVDTDDLAHGWLEAHQLLGLSKPPFYLQHMLEIWHFTKPVATDTSKGIPTEVHKRSSERLRALESLLCDRHELPLEEISPKYAPAIEALRGGPLEDRVRSFKVFARNIAQDPQVDDGMAGLLVGFALSQISQGTLRHTHLIGPNVIRDVRAVFWYGQFEGAKAIESGAAWASDNTSLRLRRTLHLARQSFGENDCDFHLEELRILCRGHKGVPHLATNRVNYARVMLHDGVSVELRYDLRSIAGGDRRRRRESDRLL
ncbi:hypothetical protein F0U59_40710 [Archangium gephyra]|nr:hypothetical protein F0U59_40710 [Archangium gephyra]